MDRAAWRAAVHGVTESPTRLCTRAQLLSAPVLLLWCSQACVGPGMSVTGP